MKRFSTLGTARNPTERDLEDKIKRIVGVENKIYEKFFNIPNQSANMPQLESYVMPNSSAYSMKVSMSNPSTNTTFIQTPFINDLARITVDTFGLNFDGNMKRLTIEDFIFCVKRLQALYSIPLEEI